MSNIFGALSINPSTYDITIFDDGRGFVLQAVQDITINESSGEEYNYEVVLTRLDDGSQEIIESQNYIDSRTNAGGGSVPSGEPLTGTYTSTITLTNTITGATLSATSNQFVYERAGEEAPLIEEENKFSSLKNTISSMFGVLSTIISEMVALITGDLLVLAIVGSFVGLIVGIIILLLNYIQRNFGFTSQIKK